MVKVYGSNGRTAKVPQYLVSNWQREEQGLQRHNSEFLRKHNAKAYLDAAAGFHVRGVIDHEAKSNLVQLGFFGQEQPI